MKEKEDYYQVQALSNSALSLFNYDPELYYKTYITKEIQSKESPALSFGTLVHNLILEPNIIDGKFIIYEGETIDNKLGDFIRHLAIFDIVDDSSITAAYEKAEFKISKEAVLKNFNSSKSQEYYNFLKESVSKIVVTQSEYDKAIRLRDKAFKILEQFESTLPEFTVENELEIYWNYLSEEGNLIPCKSKLDRLYKHTNQQLGLRYLDIKTDSQNPIHEYKKSFEYWETYRQLAFYNMSLNTTPITNYILAINTKSEKILLYQIAKAYIVKGAKEIHKNISDLEWHIENNAWEYPKSIYDRLEMDKILILQPDE